MMLLCLKRSWPKRRTVWGRIKHGFGSLMWLFGKSYYCHSELRFSNGESFSSEPPTGPRLANIAYNAEEWDAWEMDATSEQEAAIRERASKLIGRGYDGLGLLSFLSKKEIIKPSLKNDWCSEVCADAGQHGTFFWPLIPDQTTPDDLGEWANAHLARAVI